ncbi:PIN domain-containing protein [Methylomagnum ishizawai]|uniref:PIN domain-containing protein n=1 Tax=Methylomagnum ishizawai TaxID=1760988 RepID=A0A1Y6D076_9GAMM|nr:type II toxin-antitoxin system VapC family toxin [Methylomagnum ishizawai]SMF95850.1 PIN domain-containing protein [Methylomagnum ishizawai]
MILYLDTTAFLKLYVAAQESPAMHVASASAQAMYTHSLAYAEIRAGLAKAVREKYITATALPGLISTFEEDWARLRIVQASEALIRRAGDLAQGFGLRGHDSIHLAAAEAVGRALPEMDYRLALLDGKLADAARGLGMNVLNIR